MSADTRIVKPGVIEPPIHEIPFLALPAKDIFARRSERFRSLAPGHPLGGYLDFLAKLSAAQHDALNRFPDFAVPDPDEQARRQVQGMPLLEARSLHRDQAWREGLAIILDQMSRADIPAPARETVFSLMQKSAFRLEDKADRILSGDLAECSPQELPFIAAALQVYWVQMASSMKQNAFGRLSQGGLCPVCGSRPMIGIVQSGGTEQGLRYLSCSLCASRWHMVRIKCSSCESTEAIDYYILEGSNGSVKAESCGNCNSYLKLLYMAKDPQMDATADDLATLALDMLMDKEGKVRGGPNLFLHPGRS